MKLQSRVTALVVLAGISLTCGGEPTGVDDDPVEEVPGIVFTDYYKIPAGVLSNSWSIREWDMPPLVPPGMTMSEAAAHSSPDHPPLISCFVGAPNPSAPNNPEAVSTWIPLEDMAEVGLTTQRSACWVALREPPSSPVWDAEASLHMNDGGRLATHWEGWFFKVVWMDGTPRPNTGRPWVFSNAVDFTTNAELALPVGIGTSTAMPWAACYDGNSPALEGVWFKLSHYEDTWKAPCRFSWETDRWVAHISGIVYVRKQLRVVAAILP